MQAQGERARVLVLASQLVQGRLETGALRLVGVEQGRQVVAVEAGRLHGGARQETGLHGQDGAAVLARAGETVHLAGADPEDVADCRLVLGEVDHVVYGALAEEHHHVEVDAVHAAQRGVGGVPGAVGTHRADLHTDTAHAQLDRERERSDAVSAPVTACGLDGCVRHVLLVPPLSRRPCPSFTTGWHTMTFPPKSQTFIFEGVPLVRHFP